ncbi:MAG TPA: ATP-binding protein [Gammaproteobacteria bacterium]|nr:ATP-binding protein [Gammaproteobacteria bacterium]
MAHMTPTRETAFPLRSPLRWRPLSLAGLIGQPDYAGFVLMVLWFALIAICIWWAVMGVGVGFAWNSWVFHIGDMQLVFGFYLPWSVCVLLVMWLGLEWAAVPAYLATLFASLHLGLTADIAVVTALHNPLAMAVYFLFYCGFSQAYDLRSRRSWMVFIAASLAASVVSSVGSFIGTLHSGSNAADILASWLGWWPNAFLQSLLVAPLLYLFSPRVEQLKQRFFKRLPIQSFSWQQLLLAVSMFVLSLALFVLLDDHWLQSRTDMILTLPIEQLRGAIRSQFTVQQFVIWVLALLLAGISFGGVIAMWRLVHRMNARADAEARQVRDELHRSEARFRHYFEHNPAPMWVYERGSGHFLEVNRAAVERYGYSRDEFLRMTLYDIRPAEDYVRLTRQMGEMNASHEFREAGDWRHVCKDGSVLDVELHISPAGMDGVDASLALIHDVSPRKQAQRASEQRARELQILAAASLEITAAQNRQEVLQRVADRTRLLVNADLAVMRGWPLEKGVQAPVGVSLSAQYQHWQDFIGRIENSGIYELVAEKLHPLRLAQEQLLRDPGFHGFGGRDAEQLPFKGLLAVPLMGPDAELAGILLASGRQGREFDADDEALLVQLGHIASVGLENVRLHEALQAHMRELEERVAARTAELDTSNRELDAFAYSVAHDLRAPLRAMHGFANAVIEDYGAQMDAAGRDYLQRIVKAARNMDTLIQDLLAFSRVGRGEMDLQKVRLDEIVEEIMHDLEPEIESRHAAVEVRIPALTVLAHPATLRQVILNLVSNALKFVAAGAAPELRITALSRTGHVELRIKDNGIGIAPEHRERIFNVFERLHGAESYPGTGIGLSIVKKGLARMRGEIRVESGAAGSTFRVRLREFKNE